MAKSKLVPANERLAEHIISTFATVQDAVVSNYTKVEDTFVGHYLTREGESVFQARERLRKECQTRKRL